MSFEETAIWKNAFESGDGSDLLKTSFLTSRDRAKVLAEEIAKENPGFTVHDISHIDALWDTASVVLGDEFTLSPIEAYALGMSFLIHDLAMSNVSVDDVEAIEKSVRFQDLLAYQLKTILRRTATPEELADATAEQRQKALCDYLREHHAENAAKLPSLEWENAENKYRLIENPEVRESVGELVGRVAESHWWDLSRVRREFQDHVGLPSFINGESEFRPMLLAILLRTADVIQVDDRRAPSFLYAIRKPDGLSNEHWNFQNLLNLPKQVDGRLRFSAKRPFKVNERNAWWLCFDTLQYADQELGNANQVVHNVYGKNLGVHAIEGVDSAERLSKLIPTADWEPIDIQIRVSNVAKITGELGGKTLYGDTPYVGLRELVQNACDAVRARRVYENRSNGWGSVTVTLGEQDGREYLEVADTGIGMSKNVLTGALLDFGVSHWNSPQLAREYPGLLSKGFVSSGRYGIGFFSIFMLGNKVKVTTRRCKDAPSDTRVMCFSDGVNDRPILRSADDNEVLVDPGTVVKVWLTRKSTDEGGLLSRYYKEEFSLNDLCGWLFPSIDVDLDCMNGDERNRIIKANDWKEIDAAEMHKRISRYPEPRSRMKDHLKFYNKAMTTIENEFGEVVGRGSIALDAYSKRSPDDCVICNRGIRIGGAHSFHMRGLFGIFEGEPTRMSRESGKLVVTPESITKWAETQVRHLSSIPVGTEDLLDAAENLARFGANISPLRVVLSGTEWLSFEQLLSEHEVSKKITVVREFREYETYVSKKRFRPKDDVFCVIDRHWGFDYATHLESRFPEIDDALGDEKRPATWKFLVNTIAKKWNVSPSEILENSQISSESKKKKVGTYGKDKSDLLLDADVLKCP